MDALVSVEEAAKRLGGISRWTVHAWLSQGRLRRTKVGSRTMIRESELERFVAQGDEKAGERALWHKQKGASGDTLRQVKCKPIV